jgi:hypothetical protein
MAIIKKYFTNGKFNDEKFVGVTLSTALFDTDTDAFVGVQMSDGKPYLGYLAEEINAESYAELVNIILDPTDSKYEKGVFGTGLLDVPTYQKLIATKAAAKENSLISQAAELCGAWKRAESLAKVTGGTPKEVLQDFRPDLSKELLDKLETLYAK